MERHDERRLGARLEERLEGRHRIPLAEEELDRIRLEQRSAASHERQKFLAHPPAHGTPSNKKGSSRSRRRPKKIIGGPTNPLRCSESGRSEEHTSELQSPVHL